MQDSFVYKNAAITGGRDSCRLYNTRRFNVNLRLLFIFAPVLRWDKLEI